MTAGGTLLRVSPFVIVPKGVRVGFLEGLFAPFGNFYDEVQASFQTDEDYYRHAEADEWMDIYGPIDPDDKDAFLEWWYSHIGDPDFAYGWDDFREKMNAISP